MDLEKFYACNYDAKALVKLTGQGACFLNVEQWYIDVDREKSIMKN